MEGRLPTGNRVPWPDPHSGAKVAILAGSALMTSSAAKFNFASVFTDTGQKHVGRKQAKPTCHDVRPYFSALLGPLWDPGKKHRRTEVSSIYLIYIGEPGWDRTIDPLIKSARNICFTPISYQSIPSHCH